MTFEQLIAIVREWQSQMTPDQARAATEELAGRTTIGLGNLIVGAIDADALWCFASSDKPAEQADSIAFLRRLDPLPRKPKRHTKAAWAPAPPPVIEAVPLARAEAAVEAAKIPERTLIKAADLLKCARSAASGGCRGEYDAECPKPARARRRHARGGRLYRPRV